MKDWIVMFGIKLSLVCAVVATALLTGCGTTDPYGKRADQEPARQERYVERTIDQAPKWMIQTPTSSSAVYAAGTSASGDYSMAFQKAKADAYGKICMTAGGSASQRTKIYKADTAQSSSELSKIIAEGNRYRAYVLVALPTGDANILRKAKEQARVNELAAKRAPEAFKELDTQ